MIGSEKDQNVQMQEKKQLNQDIRQECETYYNRTLVVKFMVEFVECSKGRTITVVVCRKLFRDLNMCLKQSYHRQTLPFL